VLVMRHTSTSAYGPHQRTTHATDMAHERQLDEKGCDSARAVGEAVCRLRIPVGNVYSSPRSRARETASLAGFPEPEMLIQLDDMSEEDPDVSGTWLRRKVARLPAAGTNTLIVTHLPNILDAFGDRVSDVAPGEVLVFRPDYSIRATLLTCIRTDQWPALVQLASAVSGPPCPMTVWV
jgi:phosphohistidine phosphatase SixA